MDCSVAYYPYFGGCQTGQPVVSCKRGLRNTAKTFQLRRCFVYHANIVVSLFYVYWFDFTIMLPRYCEERRALTAVIT